MNTPDNRLRSVPGQAPSLRARDQSLLASNRWRVGTEPRRSLGRQSPLGQYQHHDTHALQHSRVVRTLLVGDEPRDIVFGGLGRAAPLLAQPIAARTVPTMRS